MLWMKQLRLNILVLTLSSCTGSFGSGVFTSQDNTSTPELDASRLLGSSALIAEISSSSTSLTVGNIDWISNKKTATESDYRLVPEPGVSCTLSADTIQITSSSADSYVSSALNAKVYLQHPTIIAVVATSSNGELISVNPTNRESGAFQIRLDQTKVYAEYISSLTDVYQVSIDKPAGTSLIIGASFDSEANSILLSLNGQVATSYDQVGTPSSAPTSYHSIQLGATAPNSPTLFKRLYVFSRRLNAYEHGLMLTHSAQLENLPLSLDPLFKTPTESPTFDPLFTAMRAVLQNKCSNCHSAWLSYSASQFQSDGLVIPKAPESSKLYYRLSGSSGSNGTKNMPTSGTLSSTEANAIKNWIESL